MIADINTNKIDSSITAMRWYAKDTCMYFDHWRCPKIHQSGTEPGQQTTLSWQEGINYGEGNARKAIMVTTDIGKYRIRCHLISPENIKMCWKFSSIMRAIVFLCYPLCLDIKQLKVRKENTNVSQFFLFEVCSRAGCQHAIFTFSLFSNGFLTYSQI